MNPWKLPNGANCLEATQWCKLPERPKTTWPYWMIAMDGLWQPPRGNNKNLTHFGSPYVPCVESVNKPLNTHQSKKHTVPIFLMCLRTRQHSNYRGQECKKQFAVYDSDMPVPLHKVIKPGMNW